MPHHQRKQKRQLPKHRARLVCAHLLVHAALAFVEYHTVDVLFHMASGTDATHFILHSAMPLLATF